MNDKTKSSKLMRSTALFATMTLISRILGFVRDMTFSRLFGADASLDAFLIAFRIPNFMRRLFAEGAFSQAFIPTLTEQQQQQKEISEIRLFISHTLGALSLILTIITLVAIIFSPYIINAFAPGFGHQSPRHLLATTMLRITFPYILFISVTAFWAAILNTKNSFAIPACTPIIMNICLILFAYFIAPHTTPAIIALSLGVLVAGIMQLLFLMPFVQQKRLLTIPRLNFHNAYLKQLIKRMMPAIFGSSVSQINLLIDSLFSSFLVAGSISWLYYSERLMMFPLGVFGVAIATVIMPYLSRQKASANKHQFNLTLDWGLRLLLVVGVPATIGLLILSAPIISTLFQYRAFSAHDVLMSQKSLIAFAIGIPALMSTKVLTTAFYANKNIKTPVKIAIIAMISNILLNAILIYPLKHAGIAFATTVSSMINSMLLLWTLRQKSIYSPQQGWLIYVLKLILANGLLAVMLWLLTPATAIWLKQSGSWRIKHLIMLIALATPCYWLMLWLLGIRLKQFYHEIS